MHPGWPHLWDRFQSQARAGSILQCWVSVQARVVRHHRGCLRITVDSWEQRPCMLALTNLRSVCLFLAAT